MDKRLWLNLSLAALAAILALFVYLHRDAPPAEPAQPVLTQLKAGEVKRITLSRKGESKIVLERNGSAWRMTRPLQVPANRPRIDALLAILSQSSFGRFPAASMDLGAIGLAPAQVSLGFNDLKIDFGSTEPLNKRRYVLLDGQVQLIDDDNYYSVIAQLNHYISLRLLNGDEQLSSITLPHLRLSRVGQGWKLDSKQTPKSGDDLMRLVQTWQSASALEVKPADPARARGRPQIELGLADGRPPIHLAILSTKPDLLLLRPDERLLYRFTDHQARQMLELSPDNH